MEGVAAKRWIIFPDLQLFGLKLFIARGDVAGRRFAFLARFGAVEGDDFPRHNYSFSFAGFSSASSSSSATSVAPGLSTVPSWPRRRERNARSRASWACASTAKRVGGIARRRALGS